MARKRKSSKRKGGTKRRRIGAITDKNTLMLAIGVGAGAVASTYIAQKLTSLDEKIKAAVLAAGGLLLAGKSNNPLIKGVALGISGAGIVSAAKSFGIVKAISGAPLVRFSGFNRFPNTPQASVISGFSQYPNAPQINTIGNVANMAAAWGIS